MSRLKAKTPSGDKSEKFQALNGIDMPSGGFECDECGSPAVSAKSFPREGKLRFNCEDGHMNEIFWKI